MNNILLESLLNEDESPALDFKSEQYPFTKTDEGEEISDYVKSELLKDILAFANSWRRSSAYILIGVDEVLGGRSKIRGISKHLPDASLQEFVNKKIQRPLEFSYEAYPFEGVRIGIIHIPLQERPFYLKKDFGKLKRNEVWVRRGSSSDIASPDDIAKMGLAKQDEINTQNELLILVDELNSFLEKTWKIDVYAKRIRFKYEQYQRLFEKGVINRLESSIRESLVEAFFDIKEIDRLISAGWDARPSTKWAENNNEARNMLPDTRHRAKKAVTLLENFLNSFG